MEVSVSTGLYYTKTYIEILDMIKETRCKNIEIFLNQAFIAVPVEELKEEVEKRNLKVLSIHTPLEFIAFPRKENEEFWINKAIEMAKVFNAKIIVTHMVYEDYSQKSINLDELHKKNILKYKDTKDVCLTTENFPHADDGSFLGKAAEFIKFIDDNDVNITFDTTHCASSNVSILDFYEITKKHIRNIHLSDFKNGVEHMILGQGELPLKELIGKLKQDNYEGTLTIELDFDNKKRNNVENLKQASEEIEKCISYIKEWQV